MAGWATDYSLPTVPRMDNRIPISVLDLEEVTVMNAIVDGSLAMAGMDRPLWCQCSQLEEPSQGGFFQKFSSERATTGQESGVMGNNRAGCRRSR